MLVVVLVFNCVLCISCVPVVSCCSTCVGRLNGCCLFVQISRTSKQSYACACVGTVRPWLDVMCHMSYVICPMSYGGLYSVYNLASLTY